MARYIDADAVIQYLYDEYHGMISDEDMKIYKIIRMLDHTPAADVQEVKHGKWLYEDYECSFCGESLSSIMDSDSYFSIGFNGCDYCPYCGAKMDKWCEEK